jgi:protein-tyrosine phosphatase
MGRVDLHNHILFGVDDGAIDADEAVAMAQALVQAGYTDVVTTPHCKPDMDPAESLVDARRAELQALLDARRIPLRLHAGCENHLTPSFVERVERGHPRSLAGSPYVLIELPFASAVPGLRELLFRLQLHKIRPVLAHPERCAQFVGRIDAALEVVDAGASLQIEVGSLAGIYGSAARKYVEALMDEGLVALASTDMHHPKSGQEIVTTGLKSMTKALGTSKVQLLTEENPARVLRGEPLAAF